MFSMKEYPSIATTGQLPFVNLVEPDEEEEVEEVESRTSRNRQLSSSCHSAYDSNDELRRPHRQMRRLSFGSCHTTVEFDRRVPVNESLLHEYDSPTSVLTNSRWKAEIMLSPPKKRSTVPKQSRPTWTAQVDTSKVMPKIPSRARAGASKDTAPTIPNLLRRVKQPC